MNSAVAVDSSVVVKWFKKGEDKEIEALKLRDDILAGRMAPLISEWVYLEVVRALVKAGYSKSKIARAYETLREMTDLGFIRVVPISGLLDKAKDLEVELRLYAADAVNLSVSVLNSVNMLTEDKHLLQKSASNFMEKLGLKMMKLDEFYAGEV